MFDIVNQLILARKRETPGRRYQDILKCPWLGKLMLKLSTVHCISFQSFRETFGLILPWWRNWDSKHEEMPLAPGESVCWITPKRGGPKVHDILRSSIWSAKCHFSARSFNFRIEKTSITRIKDTDSANDRIKWIWMGLLVWAVKSPSKKPLLVVITHQIPSSYGQCLHHSVLRPNRSYSVDDWYVSAELIN